MPKQPRNFEKPRRSRRDLATLLPLQQRLGHTFSNNGDLLDQALTHRSCTLRNGYERLEFLGDRIIGVIIAEYLFTAFPHEKEGDTARRLSHLVRCETLAAIARGIGLGEFIRYEDRDIAPEKVNDTLLSDVLEAVVAALYLETGMDRIKDFVLHHWRPFMDDAQSSSKDAKSTVQEWSQKQRAPLPQYKISHRAGSEHQPTFTVILTMTGFEPVEGVGSTVSEAEQKAAQQFLQHLQRMSKDSEGRA